MRKVVIRYADGRILKGETADFTPGKPLFHVREGNDASQADPLEVPVAGLKAVFFVRTHEGNFGYEKPDGFDPSHRPVGRRMKVVFKDGEILLGTTTGYQKGRPGFFLEPADPNSNNEHCYVVAAATREVTFV